MTIVFRSQDNEHTIEKHHAFLMPGTFVYLPTYRKVNDIGSYQDYYHVNGSAVVYYTYDEALNYLRLN